MTTKKVKKDVRKTTKIKVKKEVVSAKQTKKIDKINDANKTPSRTTNDKRNTASSMKSGGKTTKQTKKNTGSITRNVVCIKWGTKFDSEYVNRLYDMVERNLTLQHRFVCFTDNKKGLKKGIEVFPLPPIKFKPGPERGWRKLSVFNKKLADLKGQALCLDVDVVIINNIDYLFEEKGEFRILKDWGYPKESYVGNSGCYRFNIGKHPDVLEYFEKNFDKIREQFRNEEEYLSWKMKEKGILQYWKPKTAISFKHGCMSAFPLNFFRTPKQPTDETKILIFHGNPLPREAINGYYKLKRPQRFCRKTTWLKKFWQE